MKPPAFIKLFPVLALFILCWSCVALRARGDGIFVVTTNTDSGPGSLRQAIADANAAGGGTVSLSNVTGTITLTNGQLVLTSNLTLIGPASANLTVSGGWRSRVFMINAGSTSSISGLTIMNGNGSGWFVSILRGGGGVYNAGNLVLSNCVIRNCTVDSYSSGFRTGGGGLCNEGTLTLEGCTVFANHAGPSYAYGNIPGLGGGIYNLGVLIMNNSAVWGNDTFPNPSRAYVYGEAADGGGIYNVGSVFLTRSSISGNFSGDGPPNMGKGSEGGSGGGLYNASLAVLNECTVSDNRCGTGGHSGLDYVSPPQSGGNGGRGGGIYSAGTIYLTNCTIYGNATASGGRGASDDGFYVPDRGGDGGNGGDGAGIYSAGTLVMASCTLSAGRTGAGGEAGEGTPRGNWGINGRGGGIWNQSGTAQLLNSLIARNTASGSGPDVGGSFTSRGHNLISNTGGSQGFPGSNDLINVDPKLGPLAANGGPTTTCALLSGSPAFDAGDDSLAGTDQRGRPRPSGAHVDIGAFEVQVPIDSPYLIGPTRLGNGALRFSFTNTPGASFIVLATTNVALPSTEWNVLGYAVENTPGSFQYTEPSTTNAAQRFYQIRWP